MAGIARSSPAPVQREVGDVVAENVRRVRTARQMSLSELARRSGVAKATLSSLESAVGNPTIETLSSIAMTLGCPLAELITDTIPEVSYGAAAQWVVGQDLRGRVVTRLTSARSVDVHEVVLRQGGHLSDEPLPGSVEHFLVLAGHIDITASGDPAVTGSTVRLGVGDVIRVPAGIAYDVTAPEGEARVLVLVASR